jgi:hypothetical protein
VGEWAMAPNPQSPIPKYTQSLLFLKIRKDKY